MKNPLRYTPFLALALPLLLSSCGNDDELSDVADDAADAIKEGAETVKDAVKDAAKKVDDAVDK